MNTELKIGDQVEFKYCGSIKNGEIADLGEDKVFVRIPSAEIFIINKEDILNH